MKHNYNIMALRGTNVTDEEYVETFGLNPDVAHTPQINEVMLERTYQENLNAGVDEKKAMKLRMAAAKDIKKLLAQNGLL